MTFFLVPKTYSKIFSEIIKNFWCFNKLHKLRQYKINTISSGRGKKKRNGIEKPKNILKDDKYLQGKFGLFNNWYSDNCLCTGKIKEC